MPLWQWNRVSARFERRLQLLAKRLMVAALLAGGILASSAQANPGKLGQASFAASRAPDWRVTKLRAIGDPDVPEGRPKMQAKGAVDNYRIRAVGDPDIPDGRWWRFLNLLR